MFHTPVSFGIPRRPLLTALAAFFVIIAASAAFAQADDNEQLKRKAAELVAQKKFLEALPILEKLVAAEPDNASLQFDLGSALLVKSITAVTPDEKRSYRLRRGRHLSSHNRSATIRSLSGLLFPLFPKMAAPAARLQKIPFRMHIWQPVKTNLPKIITTRRSSFISRLWMRIRKITMPHFSSVTLICNWRILPMPRSGIKRRLRLIPISKRPTDIRQHL